MAYILYAISLFSFVLVTILYLTRSTWLPHVPSLDALPYPFNLRYDPVPTDLDSNFHSDAAAGLHSSTFDLSSNIESGDGRRGIDDAGKREVQRMMKKKGVGFDEARRLVVMERFRKEGVGADGRPRDPKFVSFS